MPQHCLCLLCIDLGLLLDSANVIGVVCFKIFLVIVSNTSATPRFNNKLMLLIKSS